MEICDFKLSLPSDDVVEKTEYESFIAIEKKWKQLIHN